MWGVTRWASDPLHWKSDGWVLQYNGVFSYSGEKNWPSFWFVVGGAFGGGPAVGCCVDCVPDTLGAGKPIIGGGGVGGTGVTVTREAGDV